MKVRNFLEKMGSLCTEDSDLGARIGLSAVLDYDYEIKNKNSAFSYKDNDNKNIYKRMIHLFAWKYLSSVNLTKAKRCEDLITLLALYSYKNKKKTTEYDQPIALLTETIESNPIPEIDNELPMDVVVRGTWLG